MNNNNDTSQGTLTADYTNFSVTAAPAPEPSSTMLLGLGLVGLFGLKLRRSVARNV